MAVGELLLALLLVLASAVGSTVPLAAFGRTREARFVLVAGGALCLLALGVMWAYGQAVADAPGYTHVPLATLALTTLASMLWLAAGLIPRRP